MPDTPRRSRIWFRRTATMIGALAAVALLAGCTGDEEAAPHDEGAGEDEPLVMLRTATCECCGAHGEHLEAAGHEVRERIVDDPNLEAGVPNGLGSCHVTLAGDHAVVGHIPAEVFAELAEEDPAVDGIALPGMPAGSPGMPGTQEEPWEFRAFSDGRPGEVFAVG
ncbi:DUF411 domain-containing protein [Egibacter rhizosphaerae]|uniref:DUF411 domain-containing protein n=1 Tax=Egibacter rhizosphaerae TaxID=1670831 RepID=A0A411YK71_9ACTN|nr:DUF411 domain-containing protein [Egibacter rhizosphaerae]QBI21614.1 DUF411 domain-containing protein [Egibacter rhizosphaerae]